MEQIGDGDHCWRGVVEGDYTLCQMRFFVACLLPLAVFWVACSEEGGVEGSGGNRFFAFTIQD